MDHHSSYSSPRSERGSGSYGGRSRNNRRNSYDKHSWKDNSRARTFVFWILPFILVNLIIFVGATATPKIEYEAADTKDYRSMDISVRIRSILPIREMSITLEGQDLETQKEKGVYKASISNNGTLQIYAKSWNGMASRLSDTIAALDDMAPTVLEDYTIEDGILTIMVEDSQSGVNFDSIYATDDTGTRIKPDHTDKGTGTVTFPMDTQSLLVYIEDYAGNTIKSSYTSIKTGIDTSDRNKDFPSDGEGGTNGNKSSGSNETLKEKETTKASKETTKAPKETSKASKETTKAAKETSKASKETTKAAKETSKASKETTKAPKETTKAPKETTKAAKETTKAAAETTKAPAESTKAPESAPAESPAPQPSQPAQSSPDTGSNEGIVIVPLQ